MKNLESYVWDLAHDIAKNALQAYTIHGTEKRFLYFRRPNSMSEVQFYNGYDNPDIKYWELAMNEHLPRHLDQRLLRLWIYNRIRQLPILPVD